MKNSSRPIGFIVLSTRGMRSENLLVRVSEIAVFQEDGPGVMLILKNGHKVLAQEKLADLTKDIQTEELDVFKHLDFKPKEHR